MCGHKATPTQGRAQSSGLHPDYYNRNSVIFNKEVKSYQHKLPFVKAISDVLASRKRSNGHALGGDQGEHSKRDSDKVCFEG